MGQSVKQLFQVLKVTNDRVVVKYMSDQVQDGKKLEKLNAMLMRHMVSKNSWEVLVYQIDLSNFNDLRSILNLFAR